MMFVRPPWVGFWRQNLLRLWTEERETPVHSEDYWTQITSIPRDLKWHYAHLLEAYESKLINWVLVKCQVTMDPVRPWTHPMIIFLVSKYIIGINILSGWTPTWVPWFIITEKMNKNLWNCLLLPKIVNQKPYHTPGKWWRLMPPLRIFMIQWWWLFSYVHILI